MSIHLMSGLPERIVTVLQDYLPAELDLIDASLADGITTPDIPNNAYYQWDQTHIAEYPACSIRIVSSAVIGEIGVRPVLFGETIYSMHRVDVLFHCNLGDSAEPRIMQDHLMRYITGAVRVLCMEKVSLETNADPTEFVEWMLWAEPATYGPDLEQEDGAIVRTATLPIAARRHEQR